MNKAADRHHMQDMTSGSSIRMIIRFAIPLVGAAIIQQLYSMTDAIVLGIYQGDLGLAILGVCSWPVWFQVSALTNLGQAACLLCAVRFGAHDEERLRRTVGNVYLVAAVVAIALTSLLLIAVTPLLSLQNTPPEIYADAVAYLRILYMGTVFSLVYNILAGLLRAVGDSYTSFMAVTISVVVNIVLDVFCVAVLDMGVRGAAIATVVSQGLSALICLRQILRYPVLKVTTRHLRTDGELLKEYVGLCLPMMAQSLVIALGGVYVQSRINYYGTAFTAGISASGKLFGLVETGATALASASASFVSQNVGAGQFDRIRSAVRQVCAVSEGIALVIAVFLILLGRQILSLYVSGDALTYAYGENCVNGVGLLIMYPMYSLRQTVQALGNLRIPLIAALVQLCMRVLTATFLPMAFGMTGIYYTNVAAWISSLVLIGVVYPRQLARCRRGMDESDS